MVMMRDGLLDPYLYPQEYDEYGVLKPPESLMQQAVHAVAPDRDDPWYTAVPKAFATPFAALGGMAADDVLGQECQQIPDFLVPSAPGNRREEPVDPGEQLLVLLVDLGHPDR